MTGLGKHAVTQCLNTLARRASASCDLSHQRFTSSWGEMSELKCSLVRWGLLAVHNSTRSVSVTILPAWTEAQMWGSRPLPSLLYNRTPPTSSDRPCLPSPSLIFLFLFAHSTVFHLASLPFFSRLRFNVVVRRFFFPRPPTQPPTQPPTHIITLGSSISPALGVFLSTLLLFFPSPAPHRVVISLPSRYLSPSFLCRGTRGLPGRLAAECSLTHDQTRRQTHLPRVRWTSVSPAATPICSPRCGGVCPCFITLPTRLRGWSFWFRRLTVELVCQFWVQKVFESQPI